MFGVTVGELKASFVHLWPIFNSFVCPNITRRPSTCSLLLICSSFRGIDQKKDVFSGTKEPTCGRENKGVADYDWTETGFQS